MFKTKIGTLKIILSTVTVICGLYLCTGVQSAHAQNEDGKINHINANERTALMRAVHIGDLTAALKLVESGVDIYIQNDDGESATSLYWKYVEENEDIAMDASDRYVWCGFMANMEEDEDMKGRWVIARLQASNPLSETELAQARERLANLIETREKILSSNTPTDE